MNNIKLTKGKRKAPKAIYFDLGYIGHVAKKLQLLFKDYTEEPNENGYYLKFVNHTYFVVNKGVVVETNIVASEAAFKKMFYNKMLYEFIIE